MIFKTVIAQINSELIDRDGVRRTLFEYRPLSYYGRKNAPPPEPPVLTPEEELKLFTRYAKTKNKRAKEILVRRYLCWAFRIASKMKGPRLDHDEAIGVANLGLIEALDSFVPSKGYRFTTYSYFVIRRHLVDALIGTYPVYISTHIRKKFKKLGKIDPKELQALDVDAPTSLDDLLERLGQTSDYRLTDLHERPEDCPFVPAPAESPNDASDRLQLSAELKDALRTQLTPLERAAVLARHGGDNAEPFESIGKRMRVSKNSVRDAYDLALVKLRNYLS